MGQNIHVFKNHTHYIMGGGGGGGGGGRGVSAECFCEGDLLLLSPCLQYHLHNLNHLHLSIYWNPSLSNEPVNKSMVLSIKVSKQISLLRMILRTPCALQNYLYPLGRQTFHDKNVPLTLIFNNDLDQTETQC